MLALAAGPALPSVDVPAIKVPPVQAPPVQVPPVHLPPVAPPELPKVELPPVAKPPVSPPGVTPVATPAATAAPAATPPRPTAATPGHTALTAEKAAPARRPTRLVAGRRHSRRAAPRADRAVAARPARAVPVGVAAPPRAHATPQPEATEAAAPPGIAQDVIDLVEALPPAILWSLLGIIAVALGLAANAYRLSRQRTALEAQRGELLDDIGLLSRALLPPVPELDGLAVSAAYRPADGPAAGGDFYDVFALDDDRVGILLGDVSGHGRDAVTLAALARYTLRTLLAAGHAPGDALAQADRLLERELRPRFVTVIAAVYDRRTTRLTYAKAGHAPPIIIGMPHDPDAETPACPIGVGIGSEWLEYHVELADGVSVCLVTDGFEVARRDGARLGRAEVERLVAAQDRPDAACLLNDLDALADQVCDDTAAIVVARA